MALASLRMLAVVAVGAGLLAAGPAAGEGLRKVTLVLGYIPDVEMYGAEYAQREGLFKAEGLDVTLIPAGQGVDQVQMVAAGIADVGMTSPEAIFAGADRGESFKIFAAQFQKSPVAMTCRKDSGVGEPGKLKGKTLGLKARAKPLFERFLSKNGLAATDFTVTTIGANDVSMIIAGRVDCMFTSFAFNEPLLIEKADVPVNVLQIGSYGMNSQSNSYFVKSSFLDDPANRALLVKLIRADTKAWVNFFKDPKAAADYIVDQKFIDGLDREQQHEQARLQVEYMLGPLTREKGLLWLNPAVYREVAENLFAAKITSKLIDAEAMLTFSILEEAQPPKL